MANKIKLKRGLSTNVSSLQLETGELAVTTDTGELYVGDKDKKVLKINDNTTYTLTKSGSTITLKGSDGSTQSVSDSNTTYSAATQSANGLMSSTDKTKLDGIATGANNYSLPTASSSTLGGVKVGTNLSISNGVLSATDTKYNAATTSAAGLMSASDKTKLDGIATGATKITVDTALSSSSTNPVQNKVINTALANKANTSAIPTKTSQLTNDSGFKTTDNNTTYSISKSGSTITLTGSDGTTSTVTDSNTTYSAATTSANGLMSSSDKTKLNGIATGAQVNNVVVSTSQPSTGEVWINPNGQTSLATLSVIGEHAELIATSHISMTQSENWADPIVPLTGFSTSNTSMFSYQSNGIKCNFSGRVLICCNYTCDTTGKEMDPEVNVSNGSPNHKSMINVGGGSASFNFMCEVNNGSVITMGVNCNVLSWKVYSSTALRVIRFK